MKKKKIFDHDTLFSSQTDCTEPRFDLFVLAAWLCLLSTINDRSFPLSLSYNIIDTQNPYARKSQMYSAPNNSNVLPSLTNLPVNISLNSTK